MELSKWDDFYIKQLEKVSKKSTCDRGRVACIIVKDGNLLVTGASGVPEGFPTCDSDGHILETIVDDFGNKYQHCVRTIHAEVDAIADAAYQGISLKGATLYCSMAPCKRCALVIIKAGISKVISEFAYHKDAESRKKLELAKVQLIVIHEVHINYSNVLTD